MKLKRTGFGVLALLLISTLVACGGSGISGKVTDSGKAPLADLTVELDQCVGEDCETIYSTTTDANGRYEFTDVAPGSYVLSITWENAPACTVLPMTRSGDFIIATAADDLGFVAFLAVQSIEYTGGGIRANLEYPCP